MEKSFTVCIVGRPNVGKSTLFNKLKGRRDAIVDGTPGVTRDRIFGRANLEGVDTLLIDTGGFEPATEDELVEQVREQALLAIEEADVICFVVDGRAGLMPVDNEIANQLRRSGKETVVAVNKIDNAANEGDLSDFYALGFEKVVALSAEHSIGFYDLIEALTSNRLRAGANKELRAAANKEPRPVTSEEPGTEEEGEKATGDNDKKPFTIAVVGCPNTGKSSLVNKMLGEDRMMVSDIPGTTRDSVDTTVKWHGQEFTFIDTAGIRKKSRISLRLEKYSVVMALKSIDRAQLALLVIDATKGVTDQTVRIAGVIEDSSRACIVLVNKWDLLEKDTMTSERFREDLGEKLKFLAFAPVVFVSAKTGQRIGKIFETIGYVMQEYQKRVDTGPLNRKVKLWLSRNPPPVRKGHRTKFFYTSQPRTSPPTFSFVVSRPDCVTDPFKRYIANRIREEYGFEGAPLVCLYQARKGSR